MSPQNTTEQTTTSSCGHELKFSEENNEILPLQRKPQNALVSLSRKRDTIQQTLLLLH